MFARLKPLRYYCPLVVGIWLCAGSVAPLWGKDAHHLTTQEERQLVLVAPQPTYPPGARSAGMKGSGVFRLHVRDETGKVVKVDVRKSTGHRPLDDAAVQTFMKWRFRPGSGVTVANIPVTFAP